MNLQYNYLPCMDCSHPSYLITNISLINIIFLYYYSFYYISIDIMITQILNYFHLLTLFFDNAFKFCYPHTWNVD